MSFLALLAASAALGLPAGAGAALPAPAGAGGHRSPHATQAAAGAGWRSLHVSVSPAPGDLTLVEIGFLGRRRGRISAATLRVAVDGPFGDDYLALATLGTHSRAGARALLLIDDRPSPLLDPARVSLTLRTARALGRPVLLRAGNPLASPSLVAAPALCSLPLDGSPLTGDELRALQVRGAALPGFGTADAVAQAYDLVCGLTRAGAFEQAIADGCEAGISCPPAPAPVPAPVPSPTPPTGCQPCDPAPGYACPLAVSPTICVAAPARATGRAGAPAH